MEESKKGFIKILYVLFFSLFFLLSLFNLLFLYIKNYNVESDFFLFNLYNNILPFIIPSTIFTIALAWFLFNGEKEKTESLEDIRKKDLQKENLRKEKFDKVFSWMNIEFLQTKNIASILMSLIFLPFNIILRLFYLTLRFLFTEGWFYIVSLFVIFLLALYLRIYNLDGLYPYTDEWVYLISAKDRLLGIGHEYNRSLFIIDVIYPFFKNFGVSLYRGRFPGALMGAATIFPLYFLTRGINKKVAILAIVLWAVYPWGIGVSQLIREYAYFPFFIVLLIIFYNKVFDYFLGKEFSWQKIITYFYVALSFIPFYYAFVINNNSTFKVFVVFVAGIGFYQMFFKHKEKFPYIIKNKYFIYLCFILILFLVNFVSNSNQLSFEIFVDNNLHYLWLFLSSSLSNPMHLYWENPNIVIIPSLLTLSIVLSLYKKDTKLKMFSIMFIITIFIYVFVFERYYKPRYMYYLLPIFIIMISYAINYLFLISKNLKYRMLLIVFLLTFFSPINIISAVTRMEHGYTQTTYEYHDDMESTIKLMKSLPQEEDRVYICTVFCGALRFYMDIDKDKIYSYSFKDEKRFEELRKIINENHKGYIILDWRRNGYWQKGLPREDFEMGGKKVRIISNKDGFQFYEWGF